MKLIFWILIILIAYTYLGYAILLMIAIGIKKLLFFNRNKHPVSGSLPEVTLLIAAYNEKDIIPSKVYNTREINYPKDLLKIIWITDGSDDGSPEVLSRYPEITVFHQSERKGKTAALNRAMGQIGTPFVIFSDANTRLDPDAVLKLITRFSDKRIGCVAGEKRIIRNTYDIAASAGEGTYWRYESFLKRLESNFYSALAAAGELYAIRTDLYLPVDPDMIIDDFVISLNIARKGYLIKYQPEAYAMENSSANIHEELKRKIRIASGAAQTMARFPSLINIFRHGFLSFEFISHKVLRWLFVPLAIPFLFLFNLILCIQTHFQEISLVVFFLLQAFFYLLVLLGLLFEEKATRWKMIFLPYYFIIVNYAQYAGFIRYFRKKHDVVWEKAKRA